MAKPMDPTPAPTETKFGEDLKTFEQLPAKTKELVVLKDQAEKSTGAENVVLTKMIREKAKQ